jgi:hypothetical protein
MTSNVQISTGAKAVEVVTEVPGNDPATTIVDPSAAMTFYVSAGHVMHIREVPDAAPVEPEVPTQPQDSSTTEPAAA